MDDRNLSNITKLEKQSLCTNMVVPSIVFYTNYIHLLAKFGQKAKFKYLNMKKLDFQGFNSKNEKKII
jgi:hypothetical protein